MTRPRQPTAGGPLEAGLMLLVPWLVGLVMAAVPTLMALPRPALDDPGRLLVVGAVTGEPQAQTGLDTDRLVLFDLAVSGTASLRCFGGDDVARERVRFDAEALQPLLGSGAETGGAGIDVEVGLPLMHGEPVLLVTVRPNRFWPPATWDSYLYELVDGVPTALMARRDEPAPLVMKADTEGRPSFTSTALSRRGVRLERRGSTYAEVRQGTLAANLQTRLSGVFARVPWWLAVLALFPVIALWMPCRGVLRETLDLLPYAPSPAAGWLLTALCLAWLLATLAACLATYALAAHPGLDLITALTAPPLLLAPTSLAGTVLGRVVRQ